MDFRDYLKLAATLAAGPAEADWRSAISRAYYAAFHVARELLISLGFRVPRADRAHSYMWLRIANAGAADVTLAGNRLNALRGLRNLADYDSTASMSQASAVNEVKNAKDIIQALDAAALEPIRTQITDVMKIHERDILHDVTWHP